MIHHLDLPVGDLARSRAFYERALAPLGLGVAMEFVSRAGQRVVGFAASSDPVFWIRDAEALRGRLHVAFAARSQACVDAFHAAALEAGGIDNGAPGLRPRYGEHWYAAFVLDPDGHNVEALCHEGDG